jgi:hypothetical protein
VNISIHIERLILDGLPVTGAQGRIVQSAVESELVRLLGVDGLSPQLLPSGGAIRSVTGGTVQLSRDHSPVRLGEQIASALHGAVSR